MPTPTKVPQSKGKKVEVKTQATTYTAVRLSMVVMTAIAMLCTSFVLAALLIRLVPVSDRGTSVAVGPKVTKSANGYVAGELLVKFAANSTQLSRTQTLQKALVKPVNVPVVTQVKKREGLRTVTRNVETITQKIATLQSITPVVSNSVQLTSVTNATRNKRGTAADVAGTAKALQQWYVVRVSPATADLNQVSNALRMQGGVEKVETNRKVSLAAGGRSLSSTTAGTTVKLLEAQNAAAPAAGDCNLDKVIDGKDLRILVNFLYLKGPAPKSTIVADVNRDGDIDIADVTALIDTLYKNLTAGYADLTADGKYTVDDLNFLVAYLYEKGPAPSPLSAADYDKDGNVDITDVTMAVEVLYGANTQGILNYGKGDANRDGVVDKRDLDYLVAYLFENGPAPSPIGLVDMDLDGALDITDVTFLVSLLYSTNDGVQAAVASPAGSTTLSSGAVSDADGGVVQPVIVPTYFLGDSNGDGRVTATDLNHLVAYLYEKGPAPSPLSRVDLDFDGNVDIADVTRMVEMVYIPIKARAALADLNGDGKVNGADLDYLVSYLFENGPTPDLAKADIDGDGNVDIADVTAMVEYVFLSQPAPVCANVRTVGTTTFLNGDVNANGSVTKTDLTALANIMYAKATLPALKDRADVDCDSDVTPLDVLALNAKLNEISTPVVLPGDANNDGAVNPADLAASVETPSDVNNDGKKNILDTYDLARLLKLNKTTKPLPDLNSDGKVNWADADIVVNGVFSKGTVSLTADVNGDGAVDAADALTYVTTLQAEQSLTSVLSGDANADNLVDCRDVKFLNATYFKKGPVASPAVRADVNGDGKQNVADVIILAKRACPVSGGGTLPSDVRVAVLDSGVKPMVVELEGTIASTKELANALDNDRNGYIADVEGWNTINGTPVVTDCQGHGTALAKILVSKTGVSPLAKIIPIRVLDCKGNGTALSVANGLVYAIIRGADIAELPFSGVGASTLLADVVRYAKASGMLVVGAAGNDSTPISRVFPANVSGVLSVGATTSNGKGLATYTNTGALVNAPGAALGVSFEGTSVSSTYVAGTAALALMKNSALTLKALEAKLIPIPSVINPKNPKVLDALKAVQ
ncbi:MAG: dockerin type I domain-containing protein [Patescibacteria group bacterium]